MPTLFYVTLQPKSERSLSLLRHLEAAGYRCVCAALDERRDTARQRLLSAFESRLPDILLVTAQDGSPLSLRPREYELLLFLMTHQGKFFSRSQLLDFVWGLDFDGGERTVDIHIRRLRAKLPPQACALLQTRRGSGYGFVSPSVSQS